ncbi:phosphoinositide phosphatase SAC6 [Tanacetum coccineum]
MREEEESARRERDRGEREKNEREKGENSGGTKDRREAAKGGKDRGRTGRREGRKRGRERERGGERERRERGKENNPSPPSPVAAIDLPITTTCCRLLPTSTWDNDHIVMKQSCLFGYRRSHGSYGTIILEVFSDNKLDPYMLPVIQGRTRTRMWIRGADLDGYVANCVESEQIILLKGFTALFVQVCVLCRGEVVISVVVQPGSWFMSGSWCRGGSSLQLGCKKLVGNQWENIRDKSVGNNCGKSVAKVVGKKCRKSVGNLWQKLCIEAEGLTALTDDDALIEVMKSINNSRYIESVLKEWREEVFFLEMGFEQKSTHELDLC